MTLKKRERARYCKRVGGSRLERVIRGRRERGSGRGDARKTAGEREGKRTEMQWERERRLEIFSCGGRGSGKERGGEEGERSGREMGGQERGGGRGREREGRERETGEREVVGEEWERGKGERAR